MTATLWTPLVNGLLLLALTFAVERGLRSHDRRIRALEDHDRRIHALESRFDAARQARGLPRRAPRGRNNLMPYEIRQAGDDWEVINTDTGAVKAVHHPPDAKDKAERQLRLLHGVENDWEPDQ